MDVDNSFTGNISALFYDEKTEYSVAGESTGVPGHVRSHQPSHQPLVLMTSQTAARLLGSYTAPAVGGL